MNRNAKSICSLAAEAAERRAARVRLADMAKRLGRSLSWLSNAERGLIDVTPDDVRQYEQTLLRLRLERAEAKNEDAA